MEKIITWCNGTIWSNVLVAFCLLVAFYFSFGTRFVQIRHFREMLRLLFHTDKDKKNGISSFQAFALALSGRVGTGNIVGVALAIGYGGPGAIVWMWIIAFFGAGTAYAEACLAQIYKEKHGDQFRGGPAYYVEKGLKSPFFAVVIAVLMVISCGLFLPPTHSNSIALSFSTTFGIAPWVVGLLVAVLIALVVFGGVSRISKVAEIVTPFMAIAYVMLSLVVLCVNIETVPSAFSLMIRSAFGVHQVLGGILGTAILWGVKRGIFSNEAGQGTAPVVAAAAEVSHPVKQGLVQGFSVYVDTLLVCTATAVMLLATNCYNVVDPVSGEYLMKSSVAGVGEPGVGYTIAALGTLLGPRWGGIVVSVTLFFFAFTTVMAYYYYAETNLIYLFTKVRQRQVRKASREERLRVAREVVVKEQQFGDDRSEKVVVNIFRVMFIVFLIIGSISEATLIWSLGDIGVGLTVWINLIAIVLLSPNAFKALRDYERQKKEGKDPVFHPKSLGIKNADFWKE